MQTSKDESRPDCMQEQIQAPGLLRKAIVSCQVLLRRVDNSYVMENVETRIAYISHFDLAHASISQTYLAHTTKSQKLQQKCSTRG